MYICWHKCVPIIKYLIKMKKSIKIFLFIELITLMVCGLAHIFAVIFNENFPLELYPILMGIVLFIFLFAIFIIEPLHNWFFD